MAEDIIQSMIPTNNRKRKRTEKEALPNLNSLLIWLSYLLSHSIKSLASSTSAIHSLNAATLLFKLVNTKEAVTVLLETLKKPICEWVTKPKGYDDNRDSEAMKEKVMQWPLTLMLCG